MSLQQKLIFIALLAALLPFSCNSNKQNKKQEEFSSFFNKFKQNEKNPTVKN